MGTIAEKLTYLNDTKTAIKNAVVAKGVSVSDTDTFRSYADKIGQIESGGGAPATKFGCTIDNLLGDVDANGALVLPAPTTLPTLNLAGVKTVNSRALSYRFYNIPKVGEFVADDLESISTNGCEYLFALDGGMGPVMTRVSMAKLNYINTDGLQYAFKNQQSITSVDVSLLATVRNNGMTGTFYNCKGLTKFYFPSLTSIQEYGFGYGYGDGPFEGCTNMTELHFRADMQATVEALAGYGEKFGATNADIIYDL